MISTSDLCYKSREGYKAQFDRVEFLRGIKIRLWEDPEHVNNHERCDRRASLDHYELQKAAYNWSDDEWVGTKREPVARQQTNKKRQLSATEELVAAVKKLHEGRALLSAKVSGVDKTADVNSEKIKSSPRQCHSVLMEIVKSSLRNHIFVQMRRALRRPARESRNTKSEILIGSDGFEERKHIFLEFFYPVEICARADCSLDLCETIADDIMVWAEAGRNSDNISFFRPYHYTQKPSRSARKFAIILRDLESFCYHLEIESSSNRGEMLMKMNVCAVLHVMRILDEYLNEKNDDNSQAHSFVGCSSDGDPKVLGKRNNANRRLILRRRNTI